jgi:acyl dehydratase
MSEIKDWQGTAFNQATASENRIHSDEVAKQYGFRGGLVPGVTVYAYLAHPAVVAWGEEWLSRGVARVRLDRPLYDRDTFAVEASPGEGALYEGVVRDSEGTVCASGSASLPETPPEAPVRRGDRPVPPAEKRPDATRAALEALREAGMGAVTAKWSPTAELSRYVRDPEHMPDVLRARRLANPAFSLGLANTMLACNVRLGPWIHVESQVQHYAPIEDGSTLAVEATVADLFERRGHEFVELDVAAFVEPDRPVLSARHRAIYRLRPPS